MARENGAARGGHSWRRCLGRAMACAGLVLAAHAARSAASDDVIPPACADVVTTGLEGPWHMVWGPDNQLWVSERAGKRITRVDPETGARKPVGAIPDAYPDTVHEGVLGFALAPDFLKPGAANHLYVYYIYRADGVRHGRLARYTYHPATNTMADPVTLIEKIPAGDDHAGGRVVFGPDGKLYLTKGEMGHNQGANTCLPIEAQRLPTADEVAKKDWTAYVGKILRFEPDGSIPADNPVLDGVRSHVYSYGHRNPQGLAFVGGLLFSCEHGPSSDDEVNLVESGMNYGWPHVAGYRDNQGYAYANYSAMKNCAGPAGDPNHTPPGVPTQQELDWPAPGNYRNPMKTFYTVPAGHVFADGRCTGERAYLCWPTVGPSNLLYYPKDGPIVPWRNSLLMTTLKNGAVYQMPLNADATQLQGDVTKLYQSANRYRCAALDPSGRTLYLLADSDGNVMDNDGRTTSTMANPGSILAFTLP